MKVQVNQKFSRVKSKQDGNFLTEYGLALLVAVIALVGLFVAYNANSGNTQANSLATDVIRLSGSIKQSYANNYGTITNAGLSTGNFFKEISGSVRDNAGVVTTNLGGGLLTVTPGTVNSANDSIQLVVTQVPDNGCRPFVTNLAKTATVIDVNGSVVKAVGAVIDPSKIVCANDNNTVTMLVQ